ncbi:MAG: dihydroorotase, partial [Acidimicrobiia bacterium]
MTRLLLTGGDVVGPDGTTTADLLVVDGLIERIGPDLPRDGVDATIDCRGAWIGPGLVDLHVHLREPGQEWKEDVATGSDAAAAGGFTAVVAQPNTEPAIDAGHVARHVVARGREVGLVDVAVAGAITLGRRGETLAHLDELWAAGARLFSDDGDTVADAGVLRRAMEYLADRGAVIAQHAEDPGLARGGHMHEGSVSARLGMRGLPAVAEEVVVARDLRLVELTGCRYHVQHVSTAGTVRLVAAAKAAGLPVTAEVAPHHLAFDHGLVEAMDGVAKMYPPLRTPDDRAALAEALVDGTIDAVATDHAPHSANEKDVPFEEAPRGVIGLETA